MNPQDARVRYTRSVLQKQFLALLDEKPLNRITVKELCQRSGINRATFYKHYQDIYDLMLTLEEDALEQMRVFFAALPSSDPEDCLCALLEYAKYRQKDWFVLFSAHGDPALAGRMLRLCEETVFPSFAERLSRLPEAKGAMVRAYISCGSSAILADWVRSDGELSARQVAKLLLSCSGAVIRRFSC